MPALSLQIAGFKGFVMNEWLPQKGKRQEKTCFSKTLDFTEIYL